jgi:peptidoglycan hydrolase CwlO-like protein
MHSKNLLEHVTLRNQALEQELQIERGKAMLAARNRQTEAEMEAMRIQVKDSMHELNETREENQQLRSNAEKYLKKIKDLEAWKLRMKSMIDGDSED